MDAEISMPRDRPITSMRAHARLKLEEGLDELVVNELNLTMLRNDAGTA